MNKGGRPTLKTDERIAKTLELAQLGKTNVQMAEIIGVSEATIRRWMLLDFEFSTAVKLLKQEADELIEASLFKSALGYDKRTKKNIVTRDGVEEIEDTTYYPPNPTSMIFWLKNRRPKQWKDRVEIQTETKETLTVIAHGNRTQLKR